jgi:sugar phosphate isomerase/epimerase
MKGDIREYARLGLVHHMLYWQSLEDPGEHVRSLSEFAGRADIETFDCCLPYGAVHRDALIPVLRQCGKEICLSAHLFPLRKISYASTSTAEQGLVRLALGEQARLAGKIGAKGFVFPSGSGGERENFPAAKAAFAQFCRWFCRELRAQGVTPMLEPFDTEIDKKFLYGPTAQCVEMVRSLGEDVGLCIELDVAHLPLMGETFKHAIRMVAPGLRRVHLGNCVLKDSSSPLYGDKHPPIGIDGGEIDVPQLAEILRLLMEVGYLKANTRSSLVLEITPFPGKSAEYSVADNMRRLEEAWEQA